MKVILLQDVANIGKRFEVKDVPNGHALNMLIPRGMAQPATPENLKRVEARKAKTAADQTAASESFAEAADKITGTTQEHAMEANEQGHLFQGIKAADVATVLTAAGFAISEEHVQLADPIKETGEHTITLSDGEKTVDFTLNVTAK